MNARDGVRSYLAMILAALLFGAAVLLTAVLAGIWVGFAIVVARAVIASAPV